MQEYLKIVDFIRKVFRNEKEEIPLHEPLFIGNEKRYVKDAIDSTFVSSVGQYVNKFEKIVCEATGAKYAVATTNGTSAIHLALISARVKPGDEVITQPLSFVATANAISYCGAAPHFVDVDLDTLGISPSLLEGYLVEQTEIKTDGCFNKKTGKRIAACMPVHTFGLPLRIKEIVNVCTKFKIPVIEDAAEALGSLYKKRHVGTFGKAGIVSFNGNKIATSGGGGVILTNDEELALFAKHLSTQAKVSHETEQVYDKVGYNYRLPNLNAALACAQLEKLDEFKKNKCELHDLYCEFFKEIDSIGLVHEIEGGESNYWLNAAILENKNERDRFLKFTNEKGIMTRPIWKPINELPMYETAPQSNLLNAKWLSERVVALPSSVRKNAYAA